MKRMHQRRQPTIAAALPGIALALLVLMLQTIPAQARLPLSADTGPFEVQTHFFRKLLADLGAKPLPRFDQLDGDPRSCVLITLGDATGMQNQFPNVREFLERGGSVLIASDRRLPRALAAQIGVAIDGRFVQAPPNESYRGTLVECPLLHPNRQPHPIFRDVSPTGFVASNRPSFLVPTSGDWPASYRRVAWISSVGPTIFADPRGPIVARRWVGVASEFPSGGRLLVLADHSIFINSMMMQVDNENVPFAYGTLRWLTEDGKRRSVLFCDNGSIQRLFDVPLLSSGQVPIPSQAGVIAAVNRALQGVEKENVLNKLVLDHMGYPRLMRGTALTITVLALAFAMLRLLSGRHRFEQRVKPAEAEPHNGRNSQNGHDRVAESARELALKTFQDLGQAAPAGVPPICTVRGSGPESRGWKKRIDQLWSVATGATPASSAAALSELHADLLDLRAAVRDGVVHFAPAS